MLTRHFLQQSAMQLGVEPKRISDAALAWLGNFGFPGNVRQLENICHWLTVMAPAQTIEPKDLPPEITVNAQALGLAGGDAAVAAGAPSWVGGSPAPAGLAATPARADSGMGEAMPNHGQVAARAEAGWEGSLEAEALALLATGRHDVWDALTRRFESKLILTALATTKGRRIEAAQKLGIGRNTITRKIQELGLE